MVSTIPLCDPKASLDSETSFRKRGRSASSPSMDPFTIAKRPTLLKISRCGAIDCCKSPDGVHHIRAELPKKMRLGAHKSVRPMLKTTCKEVFLKAIEHNIVQCQWTCLHLHRKSNAKNLHAVLLSFMGVTQIHCWRNSKRLECPEKSFEDTQRRKLRIDASSCVPPVGFLPSSTNRSSSYRSTSWKISLNAPRFL